MWKRKHKANWLPWYRAPNYKGNMTEAEKRQLDAFRMLPKHPAAQWDDLPKEVQNYITRIEGKVYDHKQYGAAGRALVISAVGGVLLFLSYKGFFGPTTIWKYAWAALILVLPWFFYRYQWKKNAEAFRPSDAPRRPSEEGIRQEWELTYLAHSKRPEHDAPSSGS